MKRVVVLVVLFAAVTAAAVNAEEPCSLNTIRGTYAWEFKGVTLFQGGISGTLPGTNIPLLGGAILPQHMTGLLTIGKDGKAEGSYTGLFGLVPLGFPTPVPLLNVAFSLRPDCTGTMDAPNAFGGVNTDAVVVLDNGREIRTVGIAGAAFRWEFTLVRIGRADETAAMCGPDTARGRYIMRCEGFEGSPGKEPGDPPTYEAVVPLFVLDVAADGTMTGRHFSRDHPEEGFIVTGDVKVNADCTSLTTMQTEALPDVTIKAVGVYYDNGKEGFGGPVVALAGGQALQGAFAGFGCHMTRLTR